MDQKPAQNPDSNLSDTLLPASSPELPPLLKPWQMILYKIWISFYAALCLLIFIFFFFLEVFIWFTVLVDALHRLKEGLVVIVMFVTASITLLPVCACVFMWIGVLSKDLYRMERAIACLKVYFICVFIFNVTLEIVDTVGLAYSNSLFKASVLEAWGAAVTVIPAVIVRSKLRERSKADTKSSSIDQV